MSKIQKTALVCSILFCLNYALYKLLGFSFFVDAASTNYWMEKAIAFFVGVAAFLDILIFKKED